MLIETRYSKYDAFARIYHEEWGQEQSEWALQPLEKLLIPHLPKDAHIFDLCCGTGQLSQQLLLKGYRVTGLDGSEAMLHYARQNAPEAHFILGDARFFEFPPTYQAVISMSASLNHVTSIEELTGVFHNVHTALLADGLFVFDLNLEERYQSLLWNGSMGGNVTDKYAWAVRQSYEPEEKIGTIATTTFQLIEENWQRSDMTWMVKGYSRVEVESALENVGFVDIRISDAERDFAIEGKAGNAYFVCRKRLNG
ncbi:MAG TPA: class I SAM-dependent methyltransferase [Cyanobacteria bacterium UBA8553]|nr:class I SAM-dependent methyltransferase [Cyanobacteria bacterium UBA8553]HAJ64167.1 class I SAM-dependent methyltransferase [Cyanobacteria bacterium UBA8543]